MNTTATTVPGDADVIVEEIAPTGAMLEAQTRGEIDIQVVTAKRFPRSIRAFQRDALEMATLNEQIAEQCFYALPRDGKTIEGPSARLAEIVASAWGHMRIEGRIVSEEERYVVARGTAWDMQRNVAIAYEVRRRITSSKGRRYNDDMIGVTGNAAASIALRNAVFKVIPKAYWELIYLEARKVAVGNAQTLADRRAKMLAHFQKLGVPAARVFAQLKVAGEQDITLDHLATLKGLATAIKDGDTSVDDAFPVDPATLQPPTKPAGNGAPPIDTPTTAAASQDDPSVRIVSVEQTPAAKKGQPSIFGITDSRGLTAQTTDALLADLADKFRVEQAAVEMTIIDGNVVELVKADLFTPKAMA